MIFLCRTSNVSRWQNCNIEPPTMLEISVSWQNWEDSSSFHLPMVKKLMKNFKDEVFFVCAPKIFLVGKIGICCMTSLQCLFAPPPLHLNRKNWDVHHLAGLLSEVSTAYRFQLFSVGKISMYRVSLLLVLLPTKFKFLWIDEIGEILFADFSIFPSNKICTSLPPPYPIWISW